MAQVSVVRHEDAGPVKEQRVIKAPGCLQFACLKAAQQQLGMRRRRHGTVNVVDEGEGGPEEGAQVSVPPLSAAASCSASRRDRASAIELRCPGRYSMVKLKPMSLLIL